MGKETGVDLDALSDEMWEKLDGSKEKRSKDRRWTGLDEILDGMMYHSSEPERQPKMQKKRKPDQPIKRPRP